MLLYGDKGLAKVQLGPFLIMIMRKENENESDPLKGLNAPCWQLVLCVSGNIIMTDTLAHLHLPLWINIVSGPASVCGLNENRIKRITVYALFRTYCMYMTMGERQTINIIQPNLSAAILLYLEWEFCIFRWLTAAPGFTGTISLVLAAFTLAFILGCLILLKFATQLELFSGYKWVDVRCFIVLSLVTCCQIQG